VTPLEVDVVVNLAHGPDEAMEVFGRLDRVSRTFLDLPLSYGGFIPADPVVPESVRMRVPFVLAAPNAPATAAVSELARRLLGVEHPENAQDRAGFFARWASWLGRRPRP